ncbi:MAG: hypothetical protein U1A78_41670 [Polyangia bacterium]
MRIDFTFITSAHHEDLPGQKQQAKTARAMWRSLQELIPGYVHLITSWVDSFMKPHAPPAPRPAPSAFSAAPCPSVPQAVSEAVVMREREAYELGQKDKTAARAKRTPVEILEHLTLVLPHEMLETLAPGSGERVVTAYALGYDRGYERQAATADKPGNKRN